MKIGLVSLGCPKNLVDSEVMLGLAQEAGHELTAHSAEADVLVVNTCAFIDRAKQESIDAILEMAAHKTTGRCRRLIVTGCLAERYRADLQKEIPEIDVVLGTGEVPDILRAIGEGSQDPQVPSGDSSDPHYRRHSDGSQPAALDVFRLDGSRVGRRVAARHRENLAQRALPTYIYDADTPRVLTTPRHFAYIKIAEGCDYNCSFCIIPVLRGQYRSRAIESILREAQGLAARGVKEILLVSQDTSFFGIDRGERHALATLLRGLDQVPGIEWVRLLYLYPTTVTDELLDTMASLPTLCPYVDLPLQHAAADVLRRMRRPGRRSAYEKLLQRIRNRVPGVAIRTSVIVGFPGETSAEFDELCDFVRSQQFDHLGVFTYSHEEGTAAHGLADDVSAREKARRKRHLMELQREIVAERQQRLVGARARLLVDGPSPEHELVVQGRLASQAPEIDSLTYLTECDPGDLPPGTLLDVEILEARGYDLVARPVARPSSV